MKRVIISFCSILLLAKILHAWLQEAPYRVENGFLTYGGFHPSFYHSLRATQIAISLSEDKLDCGFACMAEPKCASFNIAVNPDSNGLLLCELLDTDMFHDKEKLRSNASYHHYSPPSPCANHSCYNDSSCVPGSKGNSHHCKACQAGFHGTQCERKGKSCSEIKSFSPEALSGSYAIDPDGGGGCESIIVFCNMTDKNGTGVTLIGHDSEDRAFVHGYSSGGSYSRAIQYSGVSSSCISQLANLTAVSSRCEQFIKYECYHSVLLYNGNPFGWWVSRDHEKMKYWGGAGPANSYKCACGVAGQCADRSDGCHCDKNDRKWREDSGFLTEKSHLPVIELRFGDTAGYYDKGYHTLGKLKCYGTI
ncbi:contactin-associated protein-like 2 [Acropora muricata]|uniref:contactin-associated protein-like 2 n=1 Tax=Acropora muricata TaxID=159855 RepID=UPI0034E475BC